MKLRTIGLTRPSFVFLRIPLILFSLFAMKVFSEPLPISTDDFQVFHREWGTWIGLYHEYEKIRDKLPEPLSTKEYFIPIDPMFEANFEATQVIVELRSNRIWRFTTRSPEVVLKRGVVLGSGKGFIQSVYGEPWMRGFHEGTEYWQYRMRKHVKPDGFVNNNWDVITFEFDGEERMSGVIFSLLSIMDTQENVISPWYDHAR